MREVKFRVWDKEDKKMIEWETVHLEKDNDGLFMWKDDSPSSSYGTDEFNLMQYTGRVDDNAKEIYEFDVVDTDDGLGLIIYDSDYGCFAIEYRQHKIALINYLIHKHEKFWVIGNRFENPELLERL